jgi:dienelactone hydrolase
MSPPSDRDRGTGSSRCRRRTVLTALATSGVGALAGCNGSDSDGTSAPTGSPPPGVATTAETTSPAATERSTATTTAETRSRETPALPDGEWELPAYVDRSAFREIEMEVDRPGCPLPARLSMPNVVGERPFAVLVHGSGPQDMDGTTGAARPYRDLAWGLASRGIASLRYRKRLDDQEVPDEDYTLDTVVTDDAVAAVETLATAGEVDADRVFVAGHSQGGMCAPRIADRYGDAAGIVLLDGPDDPIPDPDDLQGLRYTMDVEGDLSEAQREQLEAVRESVRRIAAGEFDPDDALMGRPGVWHRSKRDCDPVGTACDLDCPTFVLRRAGPTRRRSRTSPRSSARGYEAWDEAPLPEGSRTEFYETVCHYFQHGPTPVTQTRLYFGGNVADFIVDDVAAWIDEVVGD